MSVSGKYSGRLITAMLAPAVGAGVGSLATRVHSATSKNKLTEKQKKEKHELGAAAGSLAGLGVTAYTLKKMLSGTDGGPTPPNKPKKNIKDYFKFTGSNNKPLPHPNIIKRRGNLIKVDFAKKPGFVAGFKKVAEGKIVKEVKNLGKHLHKYRKEYIMGAGAAGSVGSAAATMKATKERK